MRKNVRGARELWIKEKPEPLETARVYRLIFSLYRQSLEGAAGKFCRLLNDRLTLFGHVTNFLLIEGVGRSHEEGNGTSIDESSTHFVQFFEIGTQSLIGLRSCATSDGDCISFLWCWNLSFLNALKFEATSFENFSHVDAGELHLLVFGGHESRHARKHHLLDSLHFSQGRTGLVCSSSPTTAERYRVSFNG